MASWLIKWLCLIACMAIISLVALYVAYLAGVFIIYSYFVLSGG